ncbi:MAG: hypothetical protein QNL33_04435 [Akkermansiaceae bacterium]
MKIHLTVLAYMGVNLLHAHPHEVKKAATEQTREITLPDRILTVKKLAGPPTKPLETAAPIREQPRLQPNLPTHYYFVEASVCEDKRTFLEWHPLSGPDEIVFQAWSDLDWSQAETSGTFRHLGNHFISMTFVSRTTKEALIKKGKPLDPTVTRSRKNSARPSSFQFCGTSALTIGTSNFMEAYHHHLR